MRRTGAPKRLSLSAAIKRPRESRCPNRRDNRVARPVRSGRPAIGSDFNATVGLKKAMLRVSPSASRTRLGGSASTPTRPTASDGRYRAERGPGRETYLVAPALWPDLAAEATFSPEAVRHRRQPPGRAVPLGSATCPAPTAGWTNGAGPRWRPPTWRRKAGCASPRT